MSAKYQVSFSYSLKKVKAKVKVHNKQTGRQQEKQTGQKHQVHSIWCIEIEGLPCRTASSFYLKNQTENKYNNSNVLELMSI